MTSRSRFRFLTIIIILGIAAFSACKKESSTIPLLPISGSGGPSGLDAGDKETYTIGDISFIMAYVPGGRFPTGTGTHTSPDDIGANPATVDNPFWMAETEVTYEVWHAVRTWAVTDAGSGMRADGGPLYTFANAGSEGADGTIGAAPTAADQEPVTNINWRDAVVWCNALTEYYNANNGTEPDLDCVYYTDGDYTTPLRTSTNEDIDDPLTSGLEDQPYIKAASTGNTDMANVTATGFRLPTSMEWECAARYKDGAVWTAGDHASGATTSYTDNVATSLVGVYYRNYTDTTTYTTTTSNAAVKSKTTGYNVLGLYDMSGNIWEWCFDWATGWVGDYRVRRGGAWDGPASYLRIGYVDIFNPDDPSSYIGFRVARTE